MNYGWRFMTLYRRQESRPSPCKRRNAKRVFSMTSAFSWQNPISLCPASFCTPRPNLPVTPGVSWLPTFAFQSPIMKGHLGGAGVFMSQDALQIAVKRREVKSKGEKERYSHLNAEFQRIARRDKKTFFSNQYNKIEENNKMGKTRDLSRKLEIPREHFMQRWTW